MTGWQTHAACRGMDPDLFFPERGETTREARLVCNQARQIWLVRQRKRETA